MTTLADAIFSFLDARVGIVSPKTLRINQQYLDSLVDSLGPSFPLQSISLDHLRTWRSNLIRRKHLYGGNSTRPKLARPLSIWTVHGHLRVAKQFFKWLWTENKIQVNPALKLEFVPLPLEPSVGITEPEFDRMLTVARAQHSLRDEALLRFLYDTGCRLAGAGGLTLSRLDLPRRRAVVVEKGKGGNHKARTVYLKAKTADVLCEYLQLRCDWIEQGLRWQSKYIKTTQKKRVRRNPVKLVKRSEQSVFLSERLPHAALTTNAIYRICKRIGDLAGVQNDNPHAFRHGLPIRMLKNGAPLTQVSQILGHSALEVTRRHYGVFADHDLAEAHRRYS